MECVSDRSTSHHESGSVIIAVIIAMVVMSVLAAGLITMSGTSLYHQVGSNSSSNAFHLAEAGYRYTRSNIANLSDIHNQTFTLDTGNSFTLWLETYNFEITGSTATEIQTQIPYGSVPFESISTGGHLAVLSIIYNCSSIQVSGNNVNFRITGAGTLPSSGKVNLAALKNGSSTLIENGDIQLRTSAVLDVFPNHNGSFRVGADRFVYRTKTGNTLIGISSAEGPWPGNIPINDNDPVILDNFIELRSTGHYGSPLLGTKRRLTYHIPVKDGTGNGNSEQTDDFEDRDDWSPNTGSGSTGEGSFDITQIDGDNALIITGNTTVTGYLDTSSINYNWQDTDTDLNDIWSNSGRYLSYNAQVKVMVDTPDPSTYDSQYQNMPDNYFYMAGLNFRKQNNGDSYGLSFFRAETDNRDGIPDVFNPHVIGGNKIGTGGQAMVLLWERIGDYSSWGNWRWLAYSHVSDVNLMREFMSVYEEDFENGLSGWTQNNPYSFDIEIVTSHDNTLSRTITDSPGGNYQNRRRYRITSDPIIVSGQTSLDLSFWHTYMIEQNYDEGEVFIKPNNGGWRTLDVFDGYQNNWEQVTINLDSYLPANSIQIRFELTTDRSVTYNGWNIDDIRLESLNPKWMTLMLHLEEKEISGSKTNEIKAYISDETVRGVSNDNPQDNNRLNNTRGVINWPPDDVNETNSLNDHFTLIQWDGINTNVTLTGIGKEQDSVIQVSSITTPSTGSFAEPELGLHSWSWNYNVTYFDDFSIQTLEDAATGTEFGEPLIE